MIIRFNDHEIFMNSTTKTEKTTRRRKRPCSCRNWWKQRPLFLQVCENNTGCIAGRAIEHTPGAKRGRSTESAQGAFHGFFVCLSEQKFAANFASAFSQAGVVAPPDSPDFGKNPVSSSIDF